LGLFSALGGTAAANGSSATTWACSGASANVVGTTFLVDLTKSEVDPSEKRFATCRYASKVADRVAALELKTARVVEGFGCGDRVLKSKPAKFAYHCSFQGAGTATEIELWFTVAYVKEAIRRH
jgi:hypothetical protein